jgi:hypothetical protein
MVLLCVCGSDVELSKRRCLTRRDIVPFYRTKGLVYYDMTIITLGRLYFMLSCRLIPTNVMYVPYG